MFWKHCVLVFALGILQFVLSPGAAAQASSCYLYLSAHDLGIDLGAPVPPGAVLVNQNTVPGEGGLSIYRLTLATCAPSAAASETCPLCPSAGKPISLGTGDTYIQQSDVKIPGLGGGLSLARTWNSQWPSTQTAFQVGFFGPNWKSTYEERVFVGADNYIKYARADGSFWSFGFSTYGTYHLAAPQNLFATLLSPTTANPHWTLIFQNGEQRTFDSTTGFLLSITDRNGNTTQLSYSAGQLVTVTDPASRHLYFSYSPTNSRLVGVSSDFGISLTYAYDTQGRLSQVTYPDLSTASFAYNSQSLITTVTDSQGKILESHTYDSQGRGLTSSRAGGVDAVTVSYQ